MNRIFLWLRSGTLKLLLWVSFVILLWGVFAPVGTLAWWLRQDPASIKAQRDRLRGQKAEAETSSRSGSIDCYIVFLTGVGDFSANQLSPGQSIFLDRLTHQHPNCVAVRDVFPYSAANISLDGDNNLLTPLWRTARKADGWFENAYVVIKIRNLWHFALSIDSRYGPVYNEGIAHAIVDRMAAAHPIDQAQSPLKLILIGTSGGAQVALGAADYLNQGLADELVVISVGGDFSGAEGFAAADQIYHLQGSQDWIEDLSRFAFPQRWPLTVGSDFHQAQLQGRYHVVFSGPHSHSGSTGYFGLTPVQPNNTDTTYTNKTHTNKTYLDFTLEAVNQLPIWQ
jgi:hypothetical protein